MSKYCRFRAKKMKCVYFRIEFVDMTLATKNHGKFKKHTNVCVKKKSTLDALGGA